MNVRINDLQNRISISKSDSYEPFKRSDSEILEKLRGKVSFILANPPSSKWDDGLCYRRKVLKEGRNFLVNGGLVFLNISFQYGADRIQSLAREAAGYRFHGLIYSSSVSPFDLEREDLRESLIHFVGEEKRTGIVYTFLMNNFEGGYLSAREAYKQFEKTGRSPLTKWQTHLFEAI
jgi:methylase of polypeptide subunit release factors